MAPLDDLILSSLFLSIFLLFIMIKIDGSFSISGMNDSFAFCRKGTLIYSNATTVNRQNRTEKRKKEVFPPSNLSRFFAFFKKFLFFQNSTAKKKKNATPSANIFSVLLDGSPFLRYHFHN